MTVGQPVLCASETFVELCFEADKWIAWLIWVGIVFHRDAPENEKLVLKRSILGLGRVMNRERENLNLNDLLKKDMDPCQLRWWTQSSKQTDRDKGDMSVEEGGGVMKGGDIRSTEGAAVSKTHCPLIHHWNETWTTSVWSPEETEPNRDIKEQLNTDGNNKVPSKIKKKKTRKKNKKLLIYAS